MLSEKRLTDLLFVIVASCTLVLVPLTAISREASPSIVDKTGVEKITVTGEKISGPSISANLPHPATSPSPSGETSISGINTPTGKKGENKKVKEAKNASIKKRIFFNLLSNLIPPLLIKEWFVISGEGWSINRGVEIRVNMETDTEENIVHKSISHKKDANGNLTPNKDYEIKCSDASQGKHSEGSDNQCVLLRIGTTSDSNKHYLNIWYLDYVNRGSKSSPYFDSFSSTGVLSYFFTSPEELNQIITELASI